MEIEIRYPNLLSYRKDVEGIVKLLLERIAIGDPPFLSQLKNDHIFVDTRSAPLDDRKMVEQFVRDEFFIPDPCRQWKDIRKQSVKNSLLYRYSHANGGLKHLLSIHLNMARKKITNDDILIHNNAFEIYYIQNAESNPKSSEE